MRWIALTAWAGLLFWYGLSGPLYRTESLRAIIGQSALDGDWLYPTLYGEPFLTKPPGTYVAIGLASLPFGRVTERSARVPTALAATLVLLFVYGTFRRFVGENRAFVIALLMPVSVLWLDKAPSAEIDMLQLAWVTTALCCFLRAYAAKEEGRPALGWWIAALVCVTGGFLTKWTAPAFFYLTVGPFLVWRRRTRWLVSFDHLFAAFVAVGLCAAWATSVAERVGWPALLDTVGREAAQRFAPKAVGKPYPWVESLTFPLVVLAAMVPWSIPAACGLARRPEHWDPLTQLLHCWAWPNLLFWSLPAQHNVRYVLPVAPAVAALGILTCCRWAERGAHVVTPRRALLAVVVAWAVAKVAFVEAVVPARTAGRDAAPTAGELSRLVPDGEMLYLCKLKDEGVMFYYGRPARRFDPARLPDRPFLALLIAQEWEARDRLGNVELIAELTDQQKAPLYLVRVRPAESESWPPSRRTRTSSPSAP
ncbi:MAG TPA: glycosyltransferase family 39 protein [Gemmataceae bacterium]|jgi:4-amino-4-deoxy-L-arabinose transferase-like glycosyltransferase|nr:glycosyltransferase family 39 protein [Gemmataceae bacterium]